MVFSPLVKRQVPFLHVPVWRFQIKNGLLSGDVLSIIGAKMPRRSAPHAYEAHLSLIKYS